jgi:hypothetical protein
MSQINHIDKLLDKKNNSFLIIYTEIIKVFESNEKIDWFIIVEGQDDIVAYSKNIEKKYSSLKIKYFSARGKTNILKFIEETKKFDESKDYLSFFKHSKKKYIIDSDYDRFDEDINSVIGEYGKDLFITKVYSLDNYYFLDENIDNISAFINLNHEETIYFKDLTKAFHKFISDYEIYSFARTYLKKTKSILACAGYFPDLSKSSLDLDGLKVDDISFVDGNFKFVKQKIIDDIKKSSIETLILVNVQQLMDIKIYIMDRKRIKGKLFSKLFYEYTKKNLIEKLPLFNQLFEYSHLISMEIPVLV